MRSKVKQERIKYLMSRSSDICEKLHAAALKYGVDYNTEPKKSKARRSKLRQSARKLRDLAVEYHKTLIETIIETS